MPLLSMDQAKLAKLRQVLDMVPAPPALGQRSNRTANARVPVLVRCTSATAAGGTETGHDQCYPAVVLDVNSLVDEQAEEAAVWLTLLDGGAAASPVTVAVPVEGSAYYGVFSGSFDPFPTGTSDPRPRVFAIARASISWDEVAPDSGYAITADSTWEDTGYSITVPAGTHLIFGLASGSARVSATPPGSISIRLYDVTAAAPIPSANYQAIITTAAVVNMTFNGTATVLQFVTLTESSEIRLEAIRGAGPTWTESAVGTSARSINLGYLTVG